MLTKKRKIFRSKKVNYSVHPKRLFVIDPELKDFCGHHADYDFSVVDAAKENNINAKILCNINFNHKNNLRSILVPCFSEGIWEYKLKINKYFYKNIFAFPITIILFGKNLLRKIVPCEAFAKIKQLRIRKWMPPFLDNVINFNEKIKTDYFLTKIKLPTTILFLWLCHFGLKKLSRYYKELFKTLKKEKIENKDLVFFHMVIGNNFFESVVFSFFVRIRTKTPAVILLRYPSCFFNNKNILQKISWKIVEILTLYNWLRLASDSHRLIEEFAEITWTAFELFPIPHARNQAFNNENTKKKSKNIGFLGNPRMEKGFKEFKEFLWNFRTHQEFEKFIFYIQVHKPDEHCRCDVLVIEALSQIHKNIIIFNEALNSDEYNNLVRKLDVVFAIYDPIVYASRTSGVCMDAWSCNKSVILSNMPWAVDWMHLSKLSGTVILERNNKEITNAVLNTLKKESGKKSNQTFFNFHNSRNLLSHILGRKISSISDNSLLYIYPWDDPNAENTGAGLVSCAILDQKRNRKIYFFSGKKIDDDGFALISQFGESSPIIKLLLNFFLNTSEDKEITYRFLRILKRKEKLYLNKVLIKCSEVIISYPFLVDQLDYWLKKKGISSKIYHYDLLYEKAISKKARSFIKLKTFESLKLVEKNFFVSEEELKEMKKTHKNAFVLKHFSLLKYLKACTKKAEKYYTLPHFQFHSPFCLFFGSNAIENIQGAELFLQAASFAEQKKLNLKFAIAGSVCTSIHPKTSNVLKLGYLSQNELYQVIKCASFCFFPMISGSGISTKSSLALTLKKIVIGSKLAFKGLGSFSGKNRIVISIEKDFPSAVFSLLPKNLKSSIISGK